MSVLTLADGLLSHSDLEEFLYSLTSLTGEKPKRLYEHRIYLKGRDGQLYLSRREIPIPEQQPVLHERPLFLTDNKNMSRWNLFRLGFDHFDEREVSICRFHSYPIDQGNITGFLTDLGYTSTFEQVRVGYRFEHPNSSEATVFFPLGVEKKFNIQFLYVPGSSEGETIDPKGYTPDQWVVEVGIITPSEEVKKGKLIIQEWKRAIDRFVDLGKQTR